MGLFETAARALRREMLSRKSDVTWDGDRGWTLVGGKDGDRLPRDFRNYVREGWRRNPVIRRCVNENQTSVSEAPIRVFREDDDGNLERLVGHPGEELFKRPNRRDTGLDFIELAVQHFLLGGNVHWEKRRLGSGVPFELYPIRPDNVVSVDVDDRNMPLRWKVIADEATGRTRWIGAEDLVHIRDTDPLNEIFGMPRLVSALLETDTDNEASNYVNEILTNFGTPGTVVTVDGDKVRNQKVLERAESQWTEKFGPGRGRGKVAFLPGAQRVQNIGFNLKDLDFKGLRHITREGLCAVFGVDPMMIGIGSAAKGGTLSGNEFKEAREAFWQQTIIPMMRRIEASLNAFLAPEFGDVLLLFDTSGVAALQPDRDADSKRAKTMAEAGSYTKEEIRAETGHDPEVDEGSVLVVRGPIKFVEAGSEIPEEPEEPEIDEEDPNAPDEGEEEDVEEEDDDTASLVSRLEEDLADWEAKAATAVPAKRFSATGYSVRSIDEDGPSAWKQFDDFARAQEPTYRLAAEEMYRKQAEELRRLALVTLREKAITPESLDAFLRRLGEKFSEYHREWRRRYDDLMTQTAEVVAGRLSGATGLSFSVSNPLVRKAIEDRLNLIVGADEATFAAVKRVVEDGFVDGLSRDEMARRISGVVTEGVTVRLPSGKTRILPAAERAKLIATTETTAISNAAGNALLRGTDLSWVKMWLTQGDDRVREAHSEEEAASEENPVPLDDEFPVTGLDAPGEPNCRCTLIYEQV